jgi:hypothetical protein
MADLNRDNTDSEDEDEYDCGEIPSDIMNKVSGVPCSIFSLATFYDPDPQDEWENMKGEAALYVSETIRMKLRLLRQCMMGTQHLNHIGRLLIVLISQIGGKLCVLSFLTWNISKFG